MLDRDSDKKSALGTRAWRGLFLWRGESVKGMKAVGSKDEFGNPEGREAEKIEPEW